MFSKIVKTSRGRTSGSQRMRGLGGTEDKGEWYRKKICQETAMQNESFHPVAGSNIIIKKWKHVFYFMQSNVTKTRVNAL